MKTNHHTKCINLTILCSDAEQYRKLIEDEAYQKVTIVQCVTSPEDVDKEQVEYLLASPAMAAEILTDIPNLKWCQSTWAGNAPLLEHTRNDYILTGVKGVFGQQMREYVFTYLFHFSRNVDAFMAQQRLRVWSPPSFSYLAGKTLGILGAGSIARSLVSPAIAFDMRVIGLNSSGNSVPGFERVFSTEQKLEFALECDYVLNLLPDTAATYHFIDRAFLAALPEHSVLINAGRGAAIDDDALLEALAEDQLRGVVLDVFKEEPLPAEHSYWDHPNILITQHTAAESRPEDIVALFLDNVERYVAGRPLRYQFDFKKGY